MIKKYVLIVTEQATRQIQVVVESTNRLKAKTVFRKALKNKGRSPEDERQWTKIISTAKKSTPQYKYKGIVAKWDKFGKFPDEIDD